MRITQNSTFRRSFTAFFALVSLLGQGLHLLPGLGHDHDSCHGCADTLAEHLPDDGHCGHTHDHEGNRDRDAQGAVPEGPCFQAAAGDGHNCPVCQFLARAQLGTTATEHIVSTLIWPPRDPVAPDIYTGRDSFEPHTPRGPPADSATMS